MTWRTLALPLWVLIAACGDGTGPGGTGTGTSTGTSTGTAGPGGTGTSTGEVTDGPTQASTQGASTGSGSTSGTSTGSTSTGSTATDSTATDSETSGTQRTTESSSEGSSTGPVADACVDVSGDYGPCEAILGYGFDGSGCRLFSGCNCAPHCDDFAPDPVSCALGCAAAGACNPDAMHPAGINKDPVAQGSMCDQLDACSSDPERASWLMQIFEQVTCEPASYPCDQGQTCHLLSPATLDAAQWSQACAASLLPGADLQCVIWGP